MPEKKNILIIDPLKLDEDWSLQADRYHEAALNLAEARTELAEAEDSLELIEARVDRQFRDNPEAFGFKRATDAASESAVVLDLRVQGAKKRVRAAKDAVSKLWAFVIALDHKKKGLEDMVKLRGQDYFADPRVAEDREGRVSNADMSERARQHAFNRRRE